MISYFVKSASCLALLLFFYHFILEKEKMHSFNRFYLLIGVIISILIPFTTITINTIPETIAAVTILNKPQFSPETMATIEVEEVVDYTKYFVGFYLLISSLLLIRFGRNLFKIIQKIRLNEKINHVNATLVLVDDKILPHTFWKAIFINKNEYENGNIEEELFTHELTHVTQKHTIDVLLIELLQIIFWINPLFIFLKKAIQLNHEFLADDTVINQHKNTFQYQYLLLNKAAWNNEYYLASNLNYSLTKKRLKMMTTQSSKTIIWLKKLAVMPLLASFIFLFAERIEAQEKQEIIEVVEELPRKGIITENEVYKNYINRNAYVTYKNKEGKKVSKLYTELTNEEKKRLVLPPPPPLKLKKITPTKAQFEALKDNSKFAVWLNGKVVKNEILNKYQYSDFAGYTNSFVHKNARSKRFPQKNQASLETTKYFKAQNAKRVKEFEDYKKNYKEEIIEIVEDKGISISEMKEYQKLTTKYKSKKTANKPTIFLEKDVERMKYLYGRMNSNQQKKSLQIKNLTPSLPTINKKNTSSKQSVSTIQLKLEDVDQLRKKINSPLKVYSRKNSLYEEIRNTKPHFVKRTNTQQEQLQKTFAELGGLYFKLSKEEKSKVKRPIHPYKPYIKLKKNNNVFYKLKSELTKEDQLLFPPPLAPKNATKKQVEKSEKALEAWKKRTGNDFRTNPNLVAIPSGFTFKINEETNIILTNLNDVKKNKSHLLKLNENEKKQLAIRNTIVYASKTVKNKKFNYMIEGKEVSVYEVDSFIKQNPESSVKVSETSKNVLTLNFYTSNKKMTYDELEKVYSKLFNKKR